MMVSKGLTVSPGTAYARAALLGVVAGMRSMTPFALLSTAARPRAGTATFAAVAAGPLGFVRSRPFRLLSGLAAVGELAGDKLPVVPSRLERGPLGGRLAIGALAGAAVCRDARVGVVPGALLGAAAASAGAYAGYSVRAALGRATGVPDPVWGVVEDGVAVGLGVLALRPYLRP